MPDRQPFEITVLTERTIPVDVQAALHARFLPDSLTPADKPVIYAMAGIPGAGKSQYVDAAIESGIFPKNAFLLDPDRVMQALPAYAEDMKTLGAEKAFERWEIPARDLAYQFFAEAADRKFNIIQDMGSVRRENYERLKQLKARGYRIEMTYVYCPVEIAISRLPDRLRHTGAAMVRERADALKLLLPLYRDLADTFTVLDNSDLSHPFRRSDLATVQGL